MLHALSSLSAILSTRCLFPRRRAALSSSLTRMAIDRQMMLLMQEYEFDLEVTPADGEADGAEPMEEVQ